MRAGVDPKQLRPGDALDCFLDQAREGASDAWLAEQADVSLTQVRHWREQRGLGSSDNRAQRGLAALATMAAEYQRAAHHTDKDLDWEVPEFVVREHLSYTGFARAVHHLYHEAMLSEHQVAASIGVRVVDVELALASWRRHLGEGGGNKCLGCDAIIDHRFGSFCCRSCHDQHVPRPDLP